LTEADAAGWHVLYRGTGRRREVKAAIVVELEGERKTWLYAAADAAGVTPHEIITRLIDAARAAAVC
jgi:hypothetical protein